MRITTLAKRYHFSRRNGDQLDAACNCGVAYVPAGQRAAEAVAKNPEKSNRAIAAELGVGVESVRRAREKSGEPYGSGDRRVGKDGKSYPVKVTHSDEIPTTAQRLSVCEPRGSCRARRPRCLYPRSSSLQERNVSGLAKGFTGATDIAIAHLANAMRLSPLDPGLYQ